MVGGNCGNALNTLSSRGQCVHLRGVSKAQVANLVFESVDLFGHLFAFFAKTLCLAHHLANLRRVIRCLNPQFPLELSRTYRFHRSNHASTKALAIATRFQYARTLIARDSALNSAGARAR